MKRARREGLMKRRSIRFDVQTRKMQTKKDKERQWLTSRDPSNLVTAVLKLEEGILGGRMGLVGKRDENGMHGSKDTTSAARRATKTMMHAARRCPQPRCMLRLLLQ